MNTHDKIKILQITPRYAITNTKISVENNIYAGYNTFLFNFSSAYFYVCACNFN